MKGQAGYSVVWLGLVFVLLIFMLWSNIASASEPAVLLLEYGDPRGDDFGPGTYTYPTEDVFQASPGLFDLLAVRIWDSDEYWLFDVVMAATTNPRRAPEGFDWQLIDIYLDTIEGSGYLGVVNPEGPRVQFAPGSGWEYRIKIAPWSQAKIYISPEDSGRAIDVNALPDGSTLRAQVPKEWIDGLSSQTGIAVLVGGFDPLGPDHYRVVDEAGSIWRFGGKDPQGLGPNVLDLLADTEGATGSQESQLSSFSDQHLALIHCVYPQKPSYPYPVILLAVMLAAVVALAIGFLWGLYRRRDG
ncbi:MAG: hypothetical protein GX030_07795 [Firmicutes bacterium]|nr:hypothetical protein [Bacillota bacterium]